MEIFCVWQLDLYLYNLGGKSVVDYNIVPQVCFDKCHKFNVLPVSELIEQCNVQSLIGSRCKTPDHSILSLSFTISYLSYFTKDGCADRNDKNEFVRVRKSNTIPNRPRYRLSNFLKNFQENLEKCFKGDVIHDHSFYSK